MLLNVNINNEKIKKKSNHESNFSFIDKKNSTY